MKSFCAILALVTTTALASTAHAQTYGMDVAWNDCIGLPGAAANLNYGCDGSPDGVPFKLVVSVVQGSTLEHFVAVQMEVRVRTQSLQQLPDWWKLGVGECREGGLAFPVSLSGVGTGSTGACRNPWLGANTGGGFQWYTETAGYGPPPYDTPMPGFGKLRMAFARDTETTLEPGQRYLMGVVHLDPGPTLDPEVPCPGCETPACIVINQVELYQVVGSPGGDINLITHPAERQFVTWQGGGIGGNGCPLEVPAKRSSWGAIKATYR